MGVSLVTAFYEVEGIMQYWNGHEWEKFKMRPIKRTWRERLFALPWHPWVATKKVAPEDWAMGGPKGLSTRRYWLRYDRGKT